MKPSVYDVAIVGYGPVGQVAAALLGQQGLSVYVCERMVDVYDIPRAISLDHEIMRVFQQIGVAETVLPYTEPFTNSEYFGVDGHLIRRMTMVRPPYPQGYTPSLVFTQPAVERVLRKRVAQLPNVRVQLGVEMRGIAQDADGVTLSVREDHDHGESEDVRARYVIACDGGTSAVRTQLDLALEDLDFDEPWLVVDVLVNERGLAKLPKVSVQYCEPERPCTLVIGPANHRRWEISLKAGEDPRHVQSDEETWKLLSRWIEPEDGELWRQASYRFHALVAQQWRAHRVFLAGDAAHMQPPFLGQGMCQGMRDAANITWKLAAVLNGKVRGCAAEALLDTYGEERKAHVRELTSRIKAVGAVICERDVAKARARDERLLAECGGAVRDTPRQDILPRLEAGLLSASDSTGRGTLFPQPSLHAGSGEQRMDALLGNGWRLVCASDIAAPHDVVKWPTLLVLSLADTRERDDVAAAWFGKHAAKAALVRPDNYVYGVAASATDVQRLVDEAAGAMGFTQAPHAATRPNTSIPEETP